MEYDKLDPIGSYRDDLRIAYLGMGLARVLGSKDVKLEHFLLDFDHEEAPDDDLAEDLERKAAWLNMLFGGMDLRKPRE